MHRLWQALSIIGIICLVVFLIRNWPEEHSSQYDCGILIGGWHPDVPQKYREMCLAAKSERNDR